MATSPAAPVSEEVLRQFLVCCAAADQAGAIALLNASPPLLDLPWTRGLMQAGPGQFIHQGMMALHVASLGGSESLVRELLDRGANLHSLGSVGWTALHYAARGGHFAVAALLLNRGIDLHAVSTDKCTALHWACFHDRLDCAVLLLSRGSDLMARHSKIRNVLIDYACCTDPRLSEQVYNQRIEVLRNAFAQGPHPTQVKRRRDERWARRWSFMSVLTGCDLMPLAYRKAQLIAANPPLPPTAVITPPQTETRQVRLTRAQIGAERARLMGLVLSNEGLVRHVVSFL